jgi:hypothetical protein
VSVDLCAQVVDVRAHSELKIAGAKVGGLASDEWRGPMDVAFAAQALVAGRRGGGALIGLRSVPVCAALQGRARCRSLVHAPAERFQ